MVNGLMANLKVFPAVVCLLLWPGMLRAQTRYRVRSFAWERMEVTNRLDLQPDAEAQRIVEPYKASVDSVMMPPLGLSRRAMSGKRPESLLGNWAADVLVETSTATGMERADMGLMNVGGLRSNMPEGIVRRGDIIQISPFENKVVVVELRGSDLMELMRNIASVHGEAVSHSVRMEITKDGQLIGATIGGEPIREDRIYRVATIDYLAEGNDKMVALKKKLRQHEMNMLAREAFMEYILKTQVIDSRLEGRITVK